MYSTIAAGDHAQRDARRPRGRERQPVAPAPAHRRGAPAAPARAAPRRSALRGARLRDLWREACSSARLVLAQRELDQVAGHRQRERREQQQQRERVHGGAQRRRADAVAVVDDRRGERAQRLEEERRSRRPAWGRTSCRRRPSGSSRPRRARVRSRARRPPRSPGGSPAASRRAPRAAGSGPSATAPSRHDGGTEASASQISAIMIGVIMTVRITAVTASPAPVSWTTFCTDSFSWVVIEVACRRTARARGSRSARR